jgi:hypothetical protein
MSSEQASQPAIGAAMPLAAKQPAPVGSFTANFVYLFDTNQTNPVVPGIATNTSAHNRSLMGWSAVPEVNLTKWLGLQGDLGTMYMRSVYPGQTRTILAAGPRVTFAPRSRFTPFVYAEGGQMRESTQYSPTKDWLTVVKGGIGMEHRVSRGFAITLVPGEYMGTQQDDGTWNHSFEAKVGITFNLLAGRSYVW